MAEQLNPVEIEDVLSSIRRLVSEDLRAAPRPVRVGKNWEASKYEVLLLTEAERIVSEDVELTVHTEASAETVSFSSTVARMDDRNGDSVVVDLAARLAQTAAVTAIAPLSDPSGREAIEAVMFGFQSAQADLTSGRSAVDMIRVDDAEVVLNERVNDADPVAMIDVPPFQTADCVTDHAFLSSEDSIDAIAAGVITFEPTPFAGDDYRPAGDAEEKVPALLTFRSARAVTDERVDEELSAAQVSEHPEGEWDALHEAVLSEIVRDIIREEFQGALGERITRNVRKLVRAEINRALMTKGLI
jgi:hypothetical protein